MTKENSKYYNQYRIRVQPMVNGVKIAVPVHYETTLRKAKLLEKKLVEEAKQGFTPAGANQFLSDALEQWVDHQVELDRWSPITEEAWRYTTKMVKYYCSNLRIKNCDEDSMRKFIHDYVNDHDVTVAAHSTADKILQQLRTFFLTLEGVSIIQSPVPKKALDYFFRKERQSIVKDKYVLTDEEFRKLKQLIKKDIDRLPIYSVVSRLALWVEAETGMRPQEIQALRYSNLIRSEEHWVFRIDDSFSEKEGKFNNHLKSRKIGEWRLTPPITDKLRLELLNFKEKQKRFMEEKGITNTKDLIFLTLSDFKLAQENKPISQRTMNDVLKELCKKANVQSDDLPLTCYTLRTTVGTRLARLGDYSYASNRLGNSLAVYMRYYVKPMNRGYSDLMDEYLSM